MPPTQLKATVSWRGRGNLYVGPTQFLAWQHHDQPDVTEYVVKDFAAWKEMWGGEEGSQHVERVAFQPAAFLQSESEAAMVWLQAASDGIRRELGPPTKDFGPRWDLIGPGPAYVRALAQDGHPVPPDQLRPEELEDGPFVLLRQGKAAGGYPSLQLALNAVQDGDILEIRTDGPVAGGDLGAPTSGPRAVTLRAAPGYRPGITSRIFSDGANLLTVEGLHFHNAELSVPPGKPAGGLVRIANCAFDGAGKLTAVYRPAASGGRLEVQNCFIPRGIRTTRREKEDTSAVAISNSVLGFVGADFVGTDDATDRIPLDIRQSIVGTPLLAEDRVAGPCVWGPFVVTAEACLFHGGGVQDTRRPWRGSGNVFAVYFGRPLEQLRGESKSPEEGSVEADSAIFDPQNWRLLPSSPGYRAGPDGKDMGADVSRVASSSPADQAGGQAFQPDVHPSQAGKPDVPLPDKAKPFVLLRNGTQAGEFKGLGGALAVLQAGDEIVVHGNGPFAMDCARLDVGLFLRAAPGYRPRFAVGKPPGPGRFFCLELRGPLRVEGCDFISTEPGGVFEGGGGPCEFLACRAYARLSLEPFAGALVSWGDTPSMRVRDCLLVNQEIRAEGAPEVELTNNIACQPHGQILGIGDVRNVRLTHNTFIAGAGGRPCNVLTNTIRDDSRRSITKVEAVGNIFHAWSLVGQNAPQGSQLQLKDWLAWQGRENLYVGPFGICAQGSFSGMDFAAWRQLWGGEEGSQAVARVAFQPATFCLGTPDETLNWVRQRAEAIRTDLGAKADPCGPQWDLIGPGEPYVRALAAAGTPVPQDQLRPEELEGGPFVRIRDGNAVRGYVKLQDAVDAVQDGDTIEIRTDGPVVGCNFGAPPGTAAVTLRAAPGYRPVLSSDVNSLRGAICLTVEGLHFRNARLLVESPDKEGGGLARLANCSFEGEQTLCAAYWAADGGAMEIHNCLIPRGLTTARRDAEDTTRLAITNSVLGSIGGDLEQRELAVILRQSIVESPGLVDGREPGACFLYLTDTTAERTLFDTAGSLGVDPKRSWKGTGNIYSVLMGRPPVEELRAQWKSAEEGSLEADPVVLDPRSWQLLPSSPGYRQGPGGRDYGADVSRVANNSPAAQAVGQAFQPDTSRRQAGKPDVPAGSTPDR